MAGTEPHAMSQVGNVAGVTTDEYAVQYARLVGRGTPLGPFEQVHVFWLAGMSCDGCTIAVLGATQPSVESLLTGSLPGVPQLLLHHTAANVEAGDAFVEALWRAWRGELGAPYVVVYEGSVADESRAGAQGGYWAALGEEVDPTTGQVRQIPTAEWLQRLAPGAAAVIAIGTCATWGGIPAAYHNATGAMSVMDFLGRDYRSALGLPVVNVPGCSPIGDNFTETVAAVLLFLQGVGPLPEFDELGRPAWLFGETVHRHCVRAGYYEEGVFADEFGDRECLVEIGCWGPVVNCNIASRGAINHIGGCMNVGGACIGCTMPGFPDKFAPFYKRPPGTLVSGTASRLVGSFIRPLRRISQRDRNREVRWDQSGEVPSGWGAAPRPTFIDRLVDAVYNRLRKQDTAARDLP
jgi:hydrogenase small subunit